MIAYKTINIAKLNEFGQGTLSDLLKMEVTDIGPDYLTMRMPVNSNVLQPMGLLHGGALAALAENVGSLAGHLSVEEGKACVGLTLNCNHLKSVRNGFVTATAKAIHLGGKTQVWEVETTDDTGRLINVCRLTLAVIDKK